MSRPYDPNTKPSRLNRRRKKRWKISSRAGMLKAADTFSTGSRNLVSRQGVKTPLQGVFLCPSFSAAIGRVYRNGGAIWAAFGAGRTLSRFSTPLRTTAHDVEIIGGGLFTLDKEYPL